MDEPTSTPYRRVAFTDTKTGSRRPSQQVNRPTQFTPEVYSSSHGGTPIGMASTGVPHDFVTPARSQRRSMQTVPASSEKRGTALKKVVSEYALTSTKAKARPVRQDVRDFGDLFSGQGKSNLRRFQLVDQTEKENSTGTAAEADALHQELVSAVEIGNYLLDQHVNLEEDRDQLLEEYKREVAKRESLEQTVEELKTQLGSYSGRHDFFVNQLMDTEFQLRSLEAQVVQLKDELETTSRDLETVTDRKRTVENELDDTKRALVRSEAEVRRIARELLRKELGESKEDEEEEHWPELVEGPSAGKKGREDAAQREREEMESRLRELEGVVVDMQEQLQLQEGYISALEEERDEYKDLLEALREEARKTTPASSGQPMTMAQELCLTYGIPTAIKPPGMQMRTTPATSSAAAPGTTSTPTHSNITGTPTGRLLFSGPSPFGLVKWRSRLQTATAQRNHSNQRESTNSYAESPLRPANQTGSKSVRRASRPDAVTEEAIRLGGESENTNSCVDSPFRSANQNTSTHGGRRMSRPFMVSEQGMRSDEETVSEITTTPTKRSECSLPSPTPVANKVQPPVTQSERLVNEPPKELTNLTSARNGEGEVVPATSHSPVGSHRKISNQDAENITTDATQTKDFAHQPITSPAFEPDVEVSPIQRVLASNEVEPTVVVGQSVRPVAESELPNIPVCNVRLDGSMIATHPQSQSQSQSILGNVIGRRQIDNDDCAAVPSQQPIETSSALPNEEVVGMIAMPCDGETPSISNDDFPQVNGPIADRDETGAFNHQPIGTAGPLPDMAKTITNNNNNVVSGTPTGAKLQTPKQAKEKRDLGPATFTDTDTTATSIEILLKDVPVIPLHGYKTGMRNDVPPIENTHTPPLAQPDSTHATQFCPSDTADNNKSKQQRPPLATLHNNHNETQIKQQQQQQDLQQQRHNQSASTTIQQHAPPLLPTIPSATLQTPLSEPTTQSPTPTTLTPTPTPTLTPTPTTSETTQENTTTTALPPSPHSPSSPSTGEMSVYSSPILGGDIETESTSIYASPSDLLERRDIATTPAAADHPTNLESMQTENENENPGNDSEATLLDENGNKEVAPSAIPTDLPSSTPAPTPVVSLANGHVQVVPPRLPLPPPPPPTPPTQTNNHPIHPASKSTSSLIAVENSHPNFKSTLSPKNKGPSDLATVGLPAAGTSQTLPNMEGPSSSTANQIDAGEEGKRALTPREHPSAALQSKDFAVATAEAEALTLVGQVDQFVNTHAPTSPNPTHKNGTNHPSDPKTKGKTKRFGVGTGIASGSVASMDIEVDGDTGSGGFLEELMKNPVIANWQATTLLMAGEWFEKGKGLRPFASGRRYLMVNPATKTLCWRSKESYQGKAWARIARFSRYTSSHTKNNTHTISFYTGKGPVTLSTKDKSIHHRWVEALKATIPSSA